MTAPLIAMFAIVDGPGKVVQSGWREIAPVATGEDYRIAFAVPLTAGSYRLRFAVADANGNIGSVQRPVDAVLHRFGPLLASDLLATWTGADGASRFLALDLLPAAAATLRATVELYPDDLGASSSISVRFTLLRNDDTMPMTVRDVTPVANGGVLTAAARCPQPRPRRARTRCGPRCSMRALFWGRYRHQS